MQERDKAYKNTPQHWDVYREQGNNRNLWKGLGLMNACPASSNSSFIPIILQDSTKINSYFLSVSQKRKNCVGIAF